jgi:hypothetical protein
MNNNDDILEIKKVTEVEAIYQTKSKAMPQELRVKFENFTPMQKRYAEYRSKGMKQADAAKKAGSSAKNRAILTRTGYQWEQVEGMKEYIAFLYEKRAEASLLDEIEIVERVRNAIEHAMDMDRPDWAIKGIELMGNMIGAFSKAPGKAVKEGSASNNSKNNTTAFKNEGEEVTQEQRLKDIQSLMKSIQKTNIYKEQ